MEFLYSSIRAQKCQQKKGKRNEKKKKIGKKRKYKLFSFRKNIFFLESLLFSFIYLFIHFFLSFIT